jgi:predicted secreted protein
VKVCVFRDNQPLSLKPHPRYTAFMQFGSLLAVYFVIWWLTFVTVLPIGAQSHHEAGAHIVVGTDPGAPMKPRLVAKALLTTVLALGLTALLLWGINNETLHAYWNR